MFFDPIIRTRFSFGAASNDFLGAFRDTTEIEISSIVKVESLIDILW